MVIAYGNKDMLAFKLLINNKINTTIWSILLWVVKLIETQKRILKVFIYIYNNSCMCHKGAQRAIRESIRNKKSH